MVQTSATVCEAGSSRGSQEAAPDTDSFRQAMARLASGVAIASCWEGVTPRGLLVSSITTLSTEPPRVLFCVRKASASHNALLRATRCGLAVLAEHDQEEAERFSQADRAAGRFDPRRWALDAQAPPRYRTPLIGLDGAIGHRIDAGTHTIFVLNIRRAHASEDRPLLYFDRGFRRLAD